jgi:hypothetical protein
LGPDLRRSWRAERGSVMLRCRFYEMSCFHVCRVLQLRRRDMGDHALELSASCGMAVMPLNSCLSGNTFCIVLTWRLPLSNPRIFSLVYNRARDLEPRAGAAADPTGIAGDSTGRAYDWLVATRDGELVLYGRAGHLLPIEC